MSHSSKNKHLHPQSNSSAGVGHEPRILVVNSDREKLGEIAKLLRDSRKAQVFLAVDGIEAIRRAKEVHPNLIISDVALNRIDGFRLCRVLKNVSHETGVEIPVILTSEAYRDVVAEHVARKLGVFAFLHVPYENVELLRLVDIALHRVKPDPLEPHLLQHKGNVLIVDSNVKNIESMSRDLTADGWCVISAKSYDDARRSLANGALQIAFVNGELSDGSCMDFLKSVRRENAKVVIIAMLMNHDEEQIVRLLEEGADDFVFLPAKLEEVLAACRDARLKYNFRSVHEQFQEKIDKLRSVSDYLDMVINYSQEAIFSCDLDGTVKIWNKGAEKVYGYSAEEIIGKNVDDYLDPPDFKRKSGDVIRILMQRGSFSEPEVPRRKKTGDIFPVTATYSSILNSYGEFIGFSVVERDVTPIRALESEKIKSARLRAITQTAVTANDHINTPLGIILGYSQFLQMKLSDLSPEDTVALETIQQQVHKIKGIMNKLKLMSDPIVKNYSIEGVTMLDLNRSK